jgi:hypothetical protein
MLMLYGPALTMACAWWMGGQASSVRTMLHRNAERIALASFREAPGKLGGIHPNAGRLYRWAAAMKRGNCGCTDQMSRIDPVVDYQKQLRKASLNALKGRISGLLLKDVRYGIKGCRCKYTVDEGLWGSGSGYG